MGHDSEKTALDDAQEERQDQQPSFFGADGTMIGEKDGRQPRDAAEKTTGHGELLSSSASSDVTSVHEAEKAPSRLPSRVQSARADASAAAHAHDTGSMHGSALARPHSTAPDPDAAFVVGWDGGDADPMCPRSKSLAQKWLIVCITSFGAVCVSIYTSTYTQMNAEFHSSRLVATLGLSTFVMGIAYGPLWSPLSEFYGRRPIYLASFSLFVIWLIPSAVAQNIQTMIVARFFQGFSGSAFLSVAGGTVGDLFHPDAMNAPMAMFSIAPFIGPSIGPLLGGFINSWAHWRWTHYVLIIWSACLLLALLLLVPETYHPVLLKRKAERLRRETGDDRWQAPLEKVQRTVLQTLQLSVVRPFQLLLFEPMCLFLDLYAAILLGILYLFFGAFPLVFEHNHHFKLWQLGLSFLGLLIGVTVGGFTSPVWHHTRVYLIARRQRLSGAAVKSAEPEDRLPPCMFGAILVPIGLFWFGWSSYAHVHWIMPIIGSGFFSFGTACAFSGIFTFLVEAYPLYAASALAANALVRCSFAAAFPLFGVQMYNKLGYQWASSLLAFLALGMLPFPFLFFKYGKQIRGKSRFAKKS